MGFMAEVGRKRVIVDSTSVGWGRMRVVHLEGGAKSEWMEGYDGKEEVRLQTSFIQRGTRRRGLLDRLVYVANGYDGGRWLANARGAATGLGHRR